MLVFIQRRKEGRGKSYEEGTMGGDRGLWEVIGVMGGDRGLWEVIGAMGGDRGYGR